MTDPSTADSQSRGDLLTLRELVQRLLRHWILMASVAVVVFAAVALWTFLVTPRYESTAVVRIMDEQSQMGLADAVSSIPGLDLMGLGRDDLDTEVGVLRSWRIAGAVVDSLALMVRVRRPAGIRREVLSVRGLGDGYRQAVLTLERGSDGSYAVRAKEPDRPRQDLGRVEPAGEFEWAGYRLALADTLRAPDAPTSIRVEIAPWYEAVDDLREDVEIRQQEGRSRLVEIAYRMPDREMAAAVVNAIVQEYVAYKLSAEHVDSRFTVGELRTQVAGQAVRLAEAEERLRRYQEEQLIVAPEEEATQQVRRLAQLQLAQDKLKVERQALADLLEVIDARVRNPDTDPGQAYRQLATFPSLITNGAIQEVLVALLELENERSELLSRRTENNSDVRQFSARIAEVEGQLHRLGTDYLESLDQQLASTQTSLDTLNGILEQLPEREMEYLRLYRDRTILSEAYVLLERQLKLAEIQDAIRSEGVRIVDVGLVAHEDDPAFPRPLVTLFLGMVLALAAGMLAGLGRDLWEG